jgi:hypothetical protein
MEVSGKLHPLANSLSEERTPLPTEYKTMGPKRTISCAFQKLNPRLYRPRPHHFTTHTLPTTESHITAKLYTRAFKLNHSHEMFQTEAMKSSCCIQTGIPLTCKPMDPCASNFLNYCWNNSLHVCTTLIYGPSAFSSQGSDITINVQLYQGIM